MSSSSPLDSLIFSRCRSFLPDLTLLTESAAMFFISSDCIDRTSPEYFRLSTGFSRWMNWVLVRTFLGGYCGGGGTAGGCSLSACFGLCLFMFCFSWSSFLSIEFRSYRVEETGLERLVRGGFSFYFSWLRASPLDALLSEFCLEDLLSRAFDRFERAGFCSGL